MATTTADASPRAADMTSVTEEMIEAATMALLGHPENHAPHVDWWAERRFRISDWRGKVRAAIEATLSASPAAQTEVGKLDANEIWEFLFGRMQGAVPDELTDEVLADLASHINTHFLVSPVAQQRDEVIEASRALERGSDV